MFESFGRGFRMIAASLKMGFEDRRLLLPSILTVLTNIIFGLLLLWQSVLAMKSNVEKGGQIYKNGMPELSAMSLQHSGINHVGGHFGGHGGLAHLPNLTTLNGPLDPGGFGQLLNGVVHNETFWVCSALMVVWWLTNRMLEGVTTALVYGHLTQGANSIKFSEAVSAVMQSIPAIIMLGMVTLLAKKLAGFLRNKRNNGIFSFGFNFLAQLVEVFWTLAGHLILPAIVIEGTTFWGGVKRADKIAQGNLIAIGVGEVGVDLICRITTWLVYMGGLAGFGYAWYKQIAWNSPQIVLAAVVWASLVILITALSIYLRAAFYTCLYVWAIEAESVQESQRERIAPPAPLAAALA